MNPLDQVGTLGANSVPGLAKFSIMKADPIWAQLAGDISLLQALAIDVQAKLNVLIAAYNVAESASIPASTAPVPNL